MKTISLALLILISAPQTHADDLTYKTVDFDQWAKGPEKSVLNLFPSFRQDATADKSDSKYKNTIVFIARQSVTLSVPAASVDFSILRDLNTAQSFVGDIANMSPLAPADVKTIQKDTDFLAYRNPPSGPWCTTQGSACFQAHFNIPFMKQMLINAVMAYKHSDGSFDSQIEFSMANAAELAKLPEVQALTGIASTPTQMVQVNLFWFSHIMEFGKFVAIVQPDPSNPAHSIMSGYAVFAIERRWWDGDPYGLQDTLLGKGGNELSGILMGLPKVSEQMFNQLAQVVQK